MKTVLEFYDEIRWRNRHGIMGPLYGPTGHRGLDIAAIGNEAIPALRGGRVVLRAKSSIIGNYLVIQVGDRDYDGYCHIDDETWHALGDIKQGDKVGHAADYNDTDRGSAWTGPHLHLTNGPKITSIYIDPRSNPENVVRNVLKSLETTLMDIDQRLVGTAPVNGRKSPSSKAAEVGEDLSPGKVYRFNGWINGEPVKNNPIWFKGTNGNFYWSGAFTSQNVKGLLDLNPKPPTPVVVPPVIQPGAAQTKDELIADLQATRREAENILPANRATSIVFTKIDEALLWLTQV